jgi:hypothetical protein
MFHGIHENLKMTEVGYLSRWRRGRDAACRGGRENVIQTAKDHSRLGSGGVSRNAGMEEGNSKKNRKKLT